MFSIADIQNNQEQEFDEAEESEEADEDQPIHSYPIRCSLSVTKVRSHALTRPRTTRLRLYLLFRMTCVVHWRRCSEH